MRYSISAEGVTPAQLANFSQHAVHAAQTASKQMPQGRFVPGLVYVLINAVSGQQFVWHDPQGTKPKAKHAFEYQGDRWEGFTVPRKRRVFFTWVDASANVENAEHIATVVVGPNNNYAVQVYSATQDAGAYVAAWKDVGVSLRVQKAAGPQAMLQLISLLLGSSLRT